MSPDLISNHHFIATSMNNCKRNFRIAILTLLATLDRTGASINFAIDSLIFSKSRVESDIPNSDTNGESRSIFRNRNYTCEVTLQKETETTQ